MWGLRVSKLYTYVFVMFCSPALYLEPTDTFYTYVLQYSMWLSGSSESYGCSGWLYKSCQELKANGFYAPRRQRSPRDANMYSVINRYYRMYWLKENTVDSRYLEFQGTLWNTSRYPYVEISDLQNLGKMNRTATFNKCVCNLTPKVRDILKIL